MEYQKSVLFAKNSLPLAQGVKIAKQHPIGLIAFEKPPGVRSHPNRETKDSGALLTCPYDLEEEYFFWFDSNRKKQKLFLLNRLDAPTSGLILGTFSSEIALAIRAQFAARKVYKCYYALIKGHPLQTKQYWQNRLQVIRNSRQLRVYCSKSKGLMALTKTSFIQQVQLEGISCSIIRLEPLTGRPHQLRVQCAARALPVVGDDTYGDFRLNRIVRKVTRFPWLFLHSAEISLKLNYRDKMIPFRAQSELPQWFEDLKQK